MEIISTRYSFREAVGAGVSFSRIPEGARAALDNFRLWI
jgi:hypothetical protein